MIAVSASLQALIASGSFARADLYTITPVGGVPLTWTSADVDLTVNGVAYTHGGVRFERGMIHLVRGLETDTLDLTIHVNPEREPSVNGVPLRQAAQGGLLDGAQIALDWCYLTDWGPPPAIAGVLPRFVGVAAAQAVTRTSVKITVKSWLSLLDVQVPSQLYGPSCRFRLGDSGCGLNLGPFTGFGYVGADATTVLLPCPAINGLTSWNQGWVKMGSGVCRGLSRRIFSITNDVIRLVNPLPWVPAIGDSLWIYPTCDKTLATCDSFGNGANFGGMPFVPVPETAY